MKGYKGILCSQCTDGYYKSGISKGGQCLQCNASSIFPGNFEQLTLEQQQILNDTLLLVELIFIWFVVLIGIIYLVIVARRAQNVQENPLNDEIIIAQQPSTTSVNEQLLRSLINYIGLIALISLTYADYWWIDEQSLLDQNLKISNTKQCTMYFLQVLIYLWSIPLNRSSEIIQCTSFLNYGDNGLQTQEFVNYIIGGFLIGISFIIMLINCFFKIYNSRKSKQIPKNHNPEPLSEIPQGLSASKTPLYKDTSLAASYILPNLQNISQPNVQYYQPKDQQEFSDLKNIQNIQMAHFDHAINSVQEINLKNSNLQQNILNGPYQNQHQTGFAMEHSSITIRDDNYSPIQIASHNQSQKRLIRNNVYLQNSPDEVFQAQQIDQNSVSPFVIHKEIEINQHNQNQLEGGNKESLESFQQGKGQKNSETKSKSKTKNDLQKTKEKKVKSMEVTLKNKEQLQKDEEKVKNMNFGLTKWTAKNTEHDSRSQSSKSATKTLSKSRLLKLQIQQLYENSQQKKSNSQPRATRDSDNKQGNIDKKKKKGKKGEGNKKKSKFKEETISENIVPIPEVNEEREIDTIRQNYDHQQLHDGTISQQNQRQQHYNQDEQYDDIEQKLGVRDYQSYRNSAILIIENPIQEETKSVSWNVHKFNITTLIVGFATFIITPQFLANQFMLFSCFSVQPVQPLIDAQLETLYNFNIVQPNSTFISSVDSSFTCPTQRINANNQTLDGQRYYQPIFFTVYGTFQIILCSLIMILKSKNQQYYCIFRDTFSNLIIKGGLGAMVAFKSIANSPTAEVIIGWTGFILFLFIHIYVSVKNNSNILNKLTQDNFEISESEIANVKRIIRINSFLCIALFCANLAGMIQWIDHIYGSYTYTQYVTQTSIQDSNSDIAAYIILLLGQFLFLFYWFVEFIWNLKNYIQSFWKILEKKPAEAKKETGKNQDQNTHSQDLSVSQITKSVKVAEIDRLIQHLVNQKNNISQEDDRPFILNSQENGQSIYYRRNSQRFFNSSVVARQIDLQEEDIISEISENLNYNEKIKEKNSLNNTQKLFERNASQPNYMNMANQSSFKGLPQIPHDDNFQLGQKYFQFNNFSNAPPSPLTKNRFAASQQIFSNNNASIENLSIYLGSQNPSYRGLLDQNNFQERFQIQKSDGRTINQFAQVKSNLSTEPKLSSDKKLQELNENSSLESEFVSQKLQIEYKQEIQIISPVDKQVQNIFKNDSQNNQKDALEQTQRSVITIVNEKISKSAADANIKLEQNQEEAKSSEKDQSNDFFKNQFINLMSDFTNNNKISSRRESQNEYRNLIPNPSNISQGKVISKLEDSIQDSNKQNRISQSDQGQLQYSINSLDISVQVFEGQSISEVLPLDNSVQSNSQINTQKQITFGPQTQFSQLVECVDIKNQNDSNVQADIVPIKSTQRNLTQNIKKPKADKGDIPIVQNQVDIKNQNNSNVSADIVPIKSTQRNLIQNIQKPETSEENTSLVYNQIPDQSVQNKLTTPKQSIQEPREKMQFLPQSNNSNSLNYNNQLETNSISPISINISYTSKKNLLAGQNLHNHSQNELEVTCQSEVLNTEQQLEEEAELAKKKEELQKKVEMIKKLKEMKNQQKEKDQSTHQ